LFENLSSADLIAFAANMSTCIDIRRADFQIRAGFATKGEYAMKIVFE